MIDEPANSQPETTEPRSVGFAEAFRFWLKLGFISFGGPAGQIAIVHRELVERRRWIGEERFLHALNYCMLLPGPEATQLVTYIGWLLHRTWGGVVAGSLFILPSVFILLGLSYVYAAHGHTPAVAAFVWGLKPVVVAIVVEAVLRIGRRALLSRGSLMIAAGAFVAIYLLRVPFPLIVAAAAAAGYVGPTLVPGWFSQVSRSPGSGPPEEHAGEGAAPPPLLPLVIPDTGPPPAHTTPSRARLALVLAAGVVLWLLPFLAVGMARGWASPHLQSYVFFTKAAFVTFGGAYAVLSYVTQTAVGSFGWITAAQAVDGLGLAETTPGPLIMVLQFIGFMAGWNNPDGLSPVVSGALGALLTTWATFLPSFLFIFAGGPYIEKLRGNRRLADALTGVTAAVVGVILNLALVFGSAVILPDGPVHAPDWMAVALGVAAFLALDRLKLAVLPVVLGGGAAGLLRWLVM